MNMQSQIYLPKLTLVNKILIIISGVFFILSFILAKFANLDLTPAIGLSVSGMMSGQVWTLLTYPFLSHGILDVILNSLMLWMMGSEFEANWGTKRYVGFLLTSVVGGALLYLSVVSIFFSGLQIASFPLTGLSGIVGALCLAYAVIYPDRLFSFLMIIPVKAKYFCMILVVISLYQGVSSPLGVGAWGHLGALLFSYIFMIVISHKNFKALSQKVNEMTQVRPKSKSKAKLSIVKDDENKPPKYWQ
jgi:membrane associated rhomboid family serine protease